MKKSFYHRFSDFIEGKGFYIVLALCLAAIGLSGWFLFSSLTGEQEEQPVGGTASITVTPAPTPVATVTPVKPSVPATPPPPAPRPAPGPLLLDSFVLPVPPPAVCFGSSRANSPAA